MKHSLRQFVLPAGMLLFALAGCSNNGDSPFDETQLQATKADNQLIVRMDAPSDITSRTAVFTGYVDSDGGSEFKESGFLFSNSNENPALDNMTGVRRRRVYTLSDNSFIVNISALLPEQLYYVRAYAINQTDTAYSDIQTFQTIVAPPSVETLPVYTRLKVAAIAAGKFTSAGDELKSYGVCISRKPLPIVSNKDGNSFVEAADTAKDASMRGEFGVFFDNLEPNTLYHIRAYAINSRDTVYGNDRIFKTSRGGSLTWGWVNEQEALDAGARDRIAIAMDSAKFYYENYSNLQKYIYVQYNTGVQTADCNIEGWMRYGPNERYQWVGTAQHEISHAMGVGTASNYNAMFKSDGTWKEYRATQALRVMMSDMTQTLKISGVHFWPGGINQKEEVTNGTNNSYGVNIRNERMLKLNAIVLSAMREDGLTTY
ncbi:MAG: hypothetical protein IJ417_07415 [Bacteroidaceae bacterium]|nr:hypothetical protein [Bacteroidaceae bacterium]